MKIKHISFDAWNTVLIPNDRYAIERSEFLSVLSSKPADLCKRTYTQIKQLADHCAEHTGNQCPQKDLYQLCCDRLGIGSQFVDGIIKSFERLFVINPPTVDPLVLQALQLCKHNGVTTSISSNTNFISGTVLQPILMAHHPFDFCLFSDLLGAAKPSAEFFIDVLFEAQKLHGDKLSPSEILHIGDNEVCDGQAQLYGFAVEVIKTPQQVLDAVRKYI